MFELSLKAQPKQPKQKSYSHDEWTAKQTPADMEKAVTDFATYTVDEALNNLADWEQSIQAAAAANPTADYSAALGIVTAVRTALEAAKL